MGRPKYRVFTIKRKSPIEGKSNVKEIDFLPEKGARIKTFYIMIGLFNNGKLLSIFFGTFSCRLQLGRRQFHGDTIPMSFFSLNGVIIDELRLKTDTLYMSQLGMVVDSLHFGT